jgi:hypothetical protein
MELRTQDTQRGIPASYAQQVSEPALEGPRRTEPSWRLTEGGQYVPAWRTDVQQTWRRFGWTPKGEQ